MRFVLIKILVLFLSLIGLSSGSYAQAPGGVGTDNILWLKANEGLDLTVDVLVWTDQSSTGNNATQSNVVNRPSVYSHIHNYNPSIYFDGTAEHLNLDDMLDPLDTDFSIFAVGTNEAGGDYWHGMVSGQSDNQWTSGGFGLGSFEGNSDFGLWVADWMNHSSSTWIGSTGMPPSIVEGKFSDSQITHYRNAITFGSFPHSGTVGDGGDTFIGAGGGPDSDNHLGHVAEVIMYENVITDAERYRVNSYLAIKYGITLSRWGVAHNYVSSSGSSIYDAEGTSEYWHNILGIGRDDASALLQKQSHTQNDNCRVYLEDIYIDNVSNPGSFPDDEQFVMLGNNSDYVSVVIDANAEKPVGVFSRLAREWKVTNTMYDDLYAIDIRLNNCVDIADINPADLRLLVDDDGDFTDATIYDSTTGPNLILVGNMITIKDIPNTIFPTNDSTYFTIASINDITLSNVFEALPIASIHTCDINENGIAEFTIDHASIVSQVIGTQPGLTVSYLDEDGNTIAFSDPYTNTIPYLENITVRVTNTIGCYDETILELIIDPLPTVSIFIDVTECDFYELPAFTAADNAYYSGPDGSGTPLFPGDLITVIGTTTIYIYADNGICINQSNFDVTINPMPAIDTLMDVGEVESCASYELPALTVGEGTYYTATGGTGTVLAEGDSITTIGATTIYVYTTTGTCDDEYSFDVIIHDLPEVPTLTPVVACVSYELPDYTYSYNAYYTGSGGSGTPLFPTDIIDDIGETTIYIYADDGICINESSFTVTIHPLPILDTSMNIGEIEACDEFELPELTVGDYYTDSGGALGTGVLVPAGTIISDTTATTLYVYNSTVFCEDEYSFDILIHPLPDLTPTTDIVSCGPYELPDLLPNNSYYTEIDMGGDLLEPGYEIDNTDYTTIYIYADDGTCTAQSSFTIINPIPTIDTSFIDEEVCGSYILPEIASGEGDFYTASGGPYGTGDLLTAGDTIYDSSTIYVYSSITVAGTTCSEEYSFDVTILPIYEFDLNLENISIDNQVDITVALETLGISYEYQVDGGIFQSENQFYDLEAGNHTLTVMTANGCSIHNVDFWITIFKIPEFFSPNNDGINDFWKIEDSANTINSIYIYDRFGKNIASITPSSQGWDGMINNIPAPSSDYWYVVDINVDDVVLKGNFTLKR